MTPLHQEVSSGLTRGRRALRPPSLSLFLIAWLETFTPVACWRSFCRSGSSHPVPPCTKEQIPVSLMGYGLSTAMSSSHRVTANLWNLLHAVETVLGDDANLLAMEQIDVTSWRGPTCATSVPHATSSTTPKQQKPINNPLTYLTDLISIPEVLMTCFYTRIKTSSFNFF